MTWLNGWETERWQTEYLEKNMLLDAYLGPEEFTQWMAEETAATGELVDSRAGLDLPDRAGDLRFDFDTCHERSSRCANSWIRLCRAGRGV